MTASHSALLMDGSVGEQQMIVIGGASGFDHVGGERIGNRDVLELRSRRGEIPLSLPKISSEPEFEQLHELTLNWGEK
jgi:hypothetical protein